MENPTDNDMYSNEYDELFDAMDEELYGIEKVEEEEPERIEGYLVSDIQLCLQENSEYYLKRFREQPERDLNWTAFFCGGAWMAYRHMWREAVITSLAIIPVSLLLLPLFASILEAGGFFSYNELLVSALLSQFLICMLYGLWGDTLYWNKIKKALDCFNRKEATVPISTEEKEELFKKTKVSLAYLFIAMGIYWGGNKILQVLMAMAL